MSNDVQGGIANYLTLYMAELFRFVKKDYYCLFLGGNMKFEATFANLMMGDDKNLPDRLREQKGNLDKYKCSQAEIGKWLDDFEMPVLIDILNSPDEYFFEKFPELKSFDRSKRQTFAKKIQEHCKMCERCKLKILYSSEWKKEVKSFISNNKDSLKKYFGKPKRFFKTAK